MQCASDLDAFTADKLLTDLVTSISAGTMSGWLRQYGCYGDPVPSIWASCTNDGVMVTLLCAIGHADHEAVTAHIHGRWQTCGCTDLTDDAGVPRCCAKCADYIRILVPALSLREILAAPDAG